MAKVDWMVLCERAIVEATSNTISLVALVEVVNVPTPPQEIVDSKTAIGVPFRFYVVQQWLRAKPNISEKIRARLIMKAPNGKSFGEIEYDVDLKTVPKTRLITACAGFPLAGPGIYKCIVQAKQGTSWRAMRDAEFAVAYVHGPVMVGAPSPSLTRH